MKTIIHLLLYLFHFLEWKMLRTKVGRENQDKHFRPKIFFFSRKSFPLWDNVEKCCRAGRATDENMTHAHCMLYTSSYKHTLRICNNHCFSSAGCNERALVVLRYTHIACLVKVASVMGASHMRKRIPTKSVTHVVHSCQQKSIDLKFSKSRTGSDVLYSYHHNSSRFTFPIFAHSCRFSVLHSLQSITPRIY